MKPSVPFHKHHFEFLGDPDRARAYLEVALEDYARDHNRSVLFLALKDVAAAQGGFWTRIAREIAPKIIIDRSRRQAWVQRRRS